MDQASHRRFGETIFLPFVSEGRESGTGLGLTLAQQIAQEHGGDINLEETLEGFYCVHDYSAQSCFAGTGGQWFEKSLPARISAHGGN